MIIPGGWGELLESRLEPVLGHPDRLKPGLQPRLGTVTDRRPGDAVFHSGAPQPLEPQGSLLPHGGRPGGGGVRPRPPPPARPRLCAGRPPAAVRAPTP